MRPPLPFDMTDALRAEHERVGAVSVRQTARALALAYRDLDDLIEVMLAREVITACARQGLAMRMG
jgi:hypothetical protein